MQLILKVSISCAVVSLIATAALPSLARDFSLTGRRGSAVGTKTFTRQSNGGFQRTGQWTKLNNREGTSVVNSTLNADGSGGFQRQTTRGVTRANGKTLQTDTTTTGTYNADTGLDQSSTRSIQGPNNGSVNSNSTLTTDGQGNFQHTTTGNVTKSNGQSFDYSGSSSGTYSREEGVSSSGTHTINGQTIETTFDDGMLNITNKGASPQ